MILLPKNSTNKQLLIAQSESTDRIIISILQYFVSINLASYAGYAWVFNLKESDSLFFHMKLLIIFLSAIVLIADLIIYNVYLKTNMLAEKSSNELKELNLYYEDKGDKYLRLTHRTISFALSFFTSIAILILSVSFDNPLKIFNFKEVNMCCVILPIVVAIGLYINSQQDKPFLFGMKDC